PNICLAGPATGCGIEPLPLHISQSGLAMVPIPQQVQTLVRFESVSKTTFLVDFSISILGSLLKMTLSSSLKCGIIHCLASLGAIGIFFSLTDSPFSFWPIMYNWSSTFFRNPANPLMSTLCPRQRDVATCAANTESSSSMSGEPNVSAYKRRV